MTFSGKYDKVLTGLMLLASRGVLTITIVWAVVVFCIKFI